jgi:hypothetical protein
MFEFDLLDLTDDFEIINGGKKTIYNVDDKNSGRDWVKNKNGKIKTKEAPPLSSPFNVKQKKGTKIATEGFLATMLAGSNNVYCNTQLVGLISSGYSVATLPTLQVTKLNVFESVAYFTSRKLTKGDWANWYDEYLAPNEEHEFYGQFRYDSLIYSLFESKSNQSSLRQVEYKDQLWDIKNEFFWMSVDRMKTWLTTWVTMNFTTTLVPHLTVMYTNYCSDLRTFTRNSHLTRKQFLTKQPNLWNYPWRCVK